MESSNKMPLVTRENGSILVCYNEIGIDNGYKYDSVRLCNESSYNDVVNKLRDNNCVNANDVACQALGIELTIDLAKDDAIYAIDAYDTSSAVNGFKYGGQEFWLDKATRNGLRQSTADEIAVGRTNTTLILGDTRVVLPCEQVVGMLTQLEVYAKDCYDVTASHKIAVNALDSVDAVKAYDYTTGYPSKLSW